MSDSARDLLSRGIAAAKAHERDEARFYLERALRTDADRQQKAQAWLWLSEITDDPAEKRNCLEHALAFEPSNVLARRGLAIVDGRLDPAEIVDPDRLPATSQEEPSRSVKMQRFVCQRCGGKMGFKPDSKSLQCQYCDFEQTLFAAMTEGAMVQEHDFVVAMATAKGHARPVGMQPFTCQGCGATFLLGSTILSLTCPYCGSAHVVRLTETRRLIPPEGLIPFAVSQQDARRAFHQWMDKKGMRDEVKVSPLRGLYLPAWTFDLSGEIRWQCYTYRDEGIGIDTGGIQLTLPGSRRSRKLVREEGSHLVYENDILVPASHTLPPELLVERAGNSPLSDVIAYDEAYLADWPAEIYEISVSDASLVARRRALDKARHFITTRVNATLGYVKDLHFNTSGLVVESFKLILIPGWTARYRYEDTIYRVLVDGQTGEVRAQEPRSWLRKLFGNLFE